MSKEIREKTQGIFQENLIYGPSLCESRYIPLNNGALHKSFHCAYLKLVKVFICDGFKSFCEGEMIFENNLKTLSREKKVGPGVDP